MTELNRKIVAIVLAGGKPKPEMAAAAGCENRALIPVGNTTMLGVILSAIERSASIYRTVVVGDLPAQNGAYSPVRDHGSFTNNLFAGLRAAEEAELAILITCDLPFLTGDALSEFVHAVHESNADLVYAAVPVEVCYARFPGIRRTSVRLREGRLTGGNVVAARPAALLRQEARIQEAFEARKSPLKLARMFGWGTALRAAIAIALFPRLLGITDLERSASRILGCRVKVILSNWPELATDIDHPDDLASLRNLLGGERG